MKNFKLKILNSCLAFLALVFLNACTIPHPSNPSVQQMDQFFVSTGVVRYFMPDVPAWDNYSEIGGCYRSYQIKYLNMEQLRNSFSLDYEKAVQFQYMYNVELQSMLKRFEVERLPFKEEEALFYHILDRVEANFKAFRTPEYKRVNLVWVDEMLKNNNVELLKKKLKGAVIDTGHPVLVSLCLGHKEMEALISKLGLAQLDIRFIPSEMMSIFSSKNERNPFMGVDVKNLFGKEQKLYFYVLKGPLPELFGQGTSVNKL